MVEKLLNGSWLIDWDVLMESLIGEFLFYYGR